MKTYGRKNRRGFTLTELLVVLAIIAALSSFLLIGVQRARHISRQVTCVGNLKQIGQALVIFASQNLGAVVPLETPPDPPAGPTPTIPWFVRLQTATGLEGELETALVCPSEPNSRYDKQILANAALQDPGPGKWVPVSYGLNYDVKAADGRPYKVDINGGYAVQPLTSLDRDYDIYSMNEIEDPAQFILVADAGVGNPDDENLRRIPKAMDLRGDGVIDSDPFWRNFAVAPTVYPKQQESGVTAANTPYERIGLPHDGKGNVLFADGHVDLVGPEINRNDDRMNAFWTLPRD